MVASVMKTTKVRVLSKPDNDPTAATVDLDRWLYIEASVVIITASMPCVRSLFKAFSHKRHRRCSNDDHDLRLYSSSC